MMLFSAKTLLKLSKYFAFRYKNINLPLFLLNQFNLNDKQILIYTYSYEEIYNRTYAFENMAGSD